jgi:hypothetical protein
MLVIVHFSLSLISCYLIPIFPFHVESYRFYLVLTFLILLIIILVFHCLPMHGSVWRLWNQHLSKSFSFLVQLGQFLCFILLVDYQKNQVSFTNPGLKFLIFKFKHLTTLIFLSTFFLQVISFFRSLVYPQFEFLTWLISLKHLQALIIMLKS